MERSPDEWPEEVQAIVARGRARLPHVEASQQQVKFPGDDDGLCFFDLPGHDSEVQIESSDGCCPFLVETSASTERLMRRSVSATAEAVNRVLAEG